MFGKEEYCNLIATYIGRRAASEHGMRIVILVIQPEHVHCEVELTLAMSPSWAMQILKGRSSILVISLSVERQKLRYPKGHLWSRGKFAVSFVDSCRKILITELCEKSERASRRLGNRALLGHRRMS